MNTIHESLKEFLPLDGSTFKELKERLQKIESRYPTHSNFYLSVEAVEDDGDWNVNTEVFAYRAETQADIDAREAAKLKAEERQKARRLADYQKLKQEFGE